MKNGFWPELIGEFLGTGLIVLFGDGVVATAVLFDAYQGQWQPAVLWGMGVTLAIYMVGRICGAHLNPAVTLAFALFRDFPRRKLVPYLAAQIAGAFAAAALLYLVIGSKLAAFEVARGIQRGASGSWLTARIFATYPGADVSAFTAFCVEALLTGALVFVIFAVSDAAHQEKSILKMGLGPVVIGATLSLLIGIGGPWSMAAFNPARDLGPRLWLFVVGWRSIALPGPSSYFWVPIAGPVLGGLGGALLHRYLFQLPAQAEVVRKAA